MTPPAARHRRMALQADILHALGPDVASQVQWGRSLLPTIADASLLRPAIIRAGANHLALLEDTSVPSVLDGADGHWHAAVLSVAGAQVSRSVSDLTAAFEHHVAPLAQVQSTRRKHWTNWRSVLSWAAARACFPQLLPMATPVLKALVWDALALGCSTSVLKALLDAIQHRHHRAGLPPPLQGPRAYASMVAILSRFQGKQAPWRYPIHRSIVQRLLSWPVHHLPDWRDCLAAACATICCLRPSEGARLQVCDLWLDWDVRAGYPGFTGTAALNISVRKNDQARKGHHPRMGHSVNPALDIVWQLQQFIHRAGLHVAPNCTKQLSPHAHCKTCPPLFPLSGPNGFNYTTTPSSASFSTMILRALDLIGVDSAAFSGVCARRGGLSTAIEAGVPEAILWMQSGHAQDKSARRYVKLLAPDLLYATWAAFQL